MQMNVDLISGIQSTQELAPSHAIILRGKVGMGPFLGVFWLYGPSSCQEGTGSACHMVQLSVFLHWCEKRSLDLLACAAGRVSAFILLFLGRGLSLVTMKVHAAATPPFMMIRQR